MRTINSSRSRVELMRSLTSSSKVRSSVSSSGRGPVLAASGMFASQKSEADTPHPPAPLPQGERGELKDLEPDYLPSPLAGEGQGVRVPNALAREMRYLKCGRERLLSRARSAASAR